MSDYLTDVTPDDINYTHSGTDAIERTLQSRLEEYASVKDFGAKGDNSDDTTAINAALDWWAAASYRHLHFPGGTYQYTGSKELDFGHSRVGNIITMDGSINCTSTAKRAFIFEKFSDGQLQLNVYGGGSGGNHPNTNTFTDADPKNGGTVFLTLRAAHTSEINIEATAYAGRVLHCTGLDDEAPDKHDGGNRCVYLTIDLKGKGRNEGRIGQNFYCDSGQCDQTGAFGSIKCINDGNYYGSVLENLNDVRIDAIESGEFLKSAGLEIRGCINVHAGDVFLGETRPGNANFGSMSQWYDESSGESERSKILLNIRQSKKTNSQFSNFDRLTSNIFIDKLNCLAGGTGINIQMTDENSPGVIINQFNATQCAVPINNYDAWSSVSISNIACFDCGVVLRKIGNGETDVIKNQSYQKYDFLSIGNLIYNTKSPIELEGHHGLITITGNLRSMQRDFPLTSYGGIIYVTGDSFWKEHFDVHITNALIDSGDGNFYCVRSNFFSDGMRNLIRVTNTILNGNLIFNVVPSYVFGCKGYN